MIETNDDLNKNRLDLWKSFSVEELEELKHGLGWSDEEDVQINRLVNDRLTIEINNELIRRKK